MREEDLKTLLRRVRGGDIAVEQALKKLKKLPYENLGFARVDHHRCLRQGVPEVVYGEGKSTAQILRIIDAIVQSDNDVMVTRTKRRVFESVRKKHRGAVYKETARIILVQRDVREEPSSGLILVISAGTSDLPVAEEAAVTAEATGNKVERLYDVGVAGIHRLLAHVDLMMSARVLIVVAGMEGALPSVVGGIVDKPVVAVPTSVGYGASFQGLAALLGMLNSCSAGVSVVNIDDGFGAGYVAHLINRLGTPGRKSAPCARFPNGQGGRDP